MLDACARRDVATYTNSRTVPQMARSPSREVTDAAAAGLAHESGSGVNWPGLVVSGHVVELTGALDLGTDSIAIECGCVRIESLTLLLGWL